VAVTSAGALVAGMQNQPQLVGAGIAAAGIFATTVLGTIKSDFNSKSLPVMILDGAFAAAILTSLTFTAGGFIERINKDIQENARIYRQYSHYNTSPTSHPTRYGGPCD
jgi:hypothetical protein